MTAGCVQSLPPGLYKQLAIYRREVFVERLGWALQTDQGMEADQFDREDTVYVVAQNNAGYVSGCARLLPTTRPYLLAEVFPQLLNGLSAPCSADIWELSRFAAVDLAQPHHLTGQFKSVVTAPLLQASMACAARHGAKRLITVSPLGIERLLRKMGVQARRAGPPLVIEGYPLFACWIEVNP